MRLTSAGHYLISATRVRNYLAPAIAARSTLGRDRCPGFNSGSPRDHSCVEGRNPTRTIISRRAIGVSIPRSCTTSAIRLAITSPSARSRARSSGRHDRESVGEGAAHTPDSKVRSPPRRSIRRFRLHLAQSFPSTKRPGRRRGHFHAESPVVAGGMRRAPSGAPACDNSDGFWRVRTHSDGFGPSHTLVGPRYGWSKTLGGLVQVRRFALLQSSRARDPLPD